MAVRITNGSQPVKERMAMTLQRAAQTQSRGSAGGVAEVAVRSSSTAGATFTGISSAAYLHTRLCVAHSRTGTEEDRSTNHSAV